MHTEQEAREKWCPHARVNGIQGTTTNRSVANTGHAMCWCIASDCMAWRWGDDIGVRYAGSSDPVLQRGYCGLAGKPEVR